MKPSRADSATVAIAAMLALVARQNACASSVVAHSEAIPENTMDFHITNS
jgi:hypothetical protein